MTRLTATAIAERKSQLATRAALERMRLTLAVHSLRTSLTPPSAPYAGPYRRPLLALLIGLAAKRVGSAKLRRLVRIASFATVVYRIATSFRR